ncbi:uncharacterized protein JCM6883_004992 [Sporobolomyces salmoneus]|uniref:uncharacterized protein n=1 Tax=Sporobolomyces salmoneus TaxID=183962 RepID=UPI00316BD63F
MDHLWRLGETVARTFLPSALLPPSPEDLRTSSSSNEREDIGCVPTAEVKPFPSLPRELILRILSVTLPDPSFSTSAHRYRLLLEYSTFDKDCARWATLKLWQDVHLPSPRSAKLFFASIERNPNKERTTVVKSLRIGQSDVEEVSMFQEDWLYADVGKCIERLLAICTGIEELWVAGAKDLTLSSLSAGKALRKLYLIESRIVPSLDPQSFPFYLPRLKLLHLKAVICTGSTLDELLSPSAIPNLDTLDFFSVHQSLVTPQQQLGRRNVDHQAPPNIQQLNAMFSHLIPSPPTTRNLPPYHDLAPQIAHLSLGPYSTRTLPLSALPLFTSLVSLSIPIGLFLSPSLEPERFPLTLEALQITPETTRSEERAHERTGSEYRAQWEFARRKALNLFREKLEADFDVEEVTSEDASDFGGLGDNTRQGFCLQVDRIPNQDLEEGRRSLRWAWMEDAVGSGIRDGRWELGQERWREKRLMGG